MERNVKVNECLDKKCEKKTGEFLKGCSVQNKTGEFCDKNCGNCKNSKCSFPDGKCEGDCIDSF